MPCVPHWEYAHRGRTTPCVCTTSVSLYPGVRERQGSRGCSQLRPRAADLLLPHDQKTPWGSHLAVKIKCLCFYHKIWLHYIQAIKWIEYSLWKSQAFTSWTRNCIERVHSWAPEITKQQDYESGVLVWGPDFVGYVNLRQPLPVPVSSSVRTWNALFVLYFISFFFFWLCHEACGSMPPMSSLIQDDPSSLQWKHVILIPGHRKVLLPVL